VPAFRHGEHLIFGATARVIDRFVRLIGPALGAEPLPTGDAWPTQ